MPAIDNILKQLNEKFSADIIGTETPNERRLFVDIKPDRVRDISNEMIVLGGRYMVSIGTDFSDVDGTMQLIHTFAFDNDNLLTGIRMSVPADNPAFMSITPDIPSAGWSEREYMDLLGMKFTDHPKPKRLILADDWPEGVYPLRKEVPWNLMPPGAEDVAYQLDECPEGCTVVPVGPYHPALHEPAHFAVYVDGETIKGCDYRGFMTHRGIEKLCQTQMTYNEVPFIAERICGICGSVHATAYSQAVESAAGIPVPRRAEYIRTIMLEIERIHSHLLWLGVAGHLIGFDTVFMQAWRVREHIMWLGERMTGNRKTYGMIVIGGVRRDITPELRDDILQVVNKIEKELKVIHKSIIGDTAIHKRTKGVGRITKEDAIRWSLVGPVARARGVDIDNRRDHPYAAYNDVTFDVPVFTEGDVWATLLVRVLELYESFSIIRQLLEKMPDGELLTELDAPIEPYRHGISVVEAPRGESVHYVITGKENTPERWRVRAPTYPNLQGIPLMMLNNQLADVPIIIGSIDPCFSCTDRVEVVDLQSGNCRVASKEELETLSRNYRDGR
ncbi:MAG TPA: NADH-quinone oxidoreductase subunit C [Spirochaetota bacterium]|nr:NADH-quinone oxidoreductase subunit C [Spirochaetota bacterium]